MQTLKLRFAAVTEHLRGSLWFLPTLLVGAALLAATVLARTRAELPNNVLFDLILPASVDGARAVLQVVAGSVVTVTSVVFSLTVIALQISATNYSPRVLRTFLRDRGTQMVLAVFLATFAYSFVVLQNVQETGGRAEDWRPQLAVAALVPFVLGSLAALVFFIHHVTQSIRVDTILRDVLDETLEAIDKIYSSEERVCRPLMELVPDQAGSVSARRSGYVQAVNPDALVSKASERNLVLALRPVLGDYVVEGATIAWVWSDDGEQASAEDVDALVDDAVHFGTERTMQQDVPFGLRQLVDVAVRALSPGVNDPNTAVAVISHLTRAYALLAQRPLGHRLYEDESAMMRLVVPGPDLDEYLHIATQQITEYGRKDAMVLERLLRMLAEVNAISDQEHGDTIARHVNRVVAQAESFIGLEEDMDAIREAADQARKGICSPTHLTRGG